MLGKKGGCQSVVMAAAAVRTENRISDAFKLEMPGSKAGWDSMVERCD